MADDGQGEANVVLRHVLQFGWSSRFNHRDSFGRYGMGLPNASEPRDSVKKGRYAPDQVSFYS